MLVWAGGLLCARMLWAGRVVCAFAGSLVASLTAPRPARPPTSPGGVIDPSQTMDREEAAECEKMHTIVKVGGAVTPCGR